MSMHTARCYWCLHTSTGCTGACRQRGGTPVWHGPHRIEKGCICPPGAEATCQRSDCGRKDRRDAATVSGYAKTVSGYNDKLFSNLPGNTPEAKAYAAAMARKMQSPGGIGDIHKYQRSPSPSETSDDYYPLSKLPSEDDGA